MNSLLIGHTSGILGTAIWFRSQWERIVLLDMKLELVAIATVAVKVEFDVVSCSD